MPPVATCILLIDDEPDIRQFLDISLRAQGYGTVCREDGRSGLEALLQEPRPDAVILDLGLPDLDGAQVLAHIRERSDVPVIVLTVRSDEAQKVALLDAGANDFVTKPFGIQELMARLRLVLRHRAQAEAVSVFDDGQLRVDLANHSVTLHGEPVALTKKEYALLAVLARQPGRLISHGRILSEVWGPTHEEDVHYLRIVVAKLRRKLGDDALNPHYLVTEPGVGLRFGGGS